MKIICLKGGLGNQIFEYCRYRGLTEKKKEKVFLFYEKKKLKQHNFHMISDCFDVSLPKTPFYINYIVFGIKLLRAFHLFPRLYDDIRDDCLLIDDYCQDIQFIHNAQQYLKFRDFSLSHHHQTCLEQIQSSSFPVSVHIRRGDYLNKDNLESFGICSVDYYMTSIQTVKESHPDASFFFFSDDMEWVKQNILIPQAVYITNHDAPDYIDLFLMTKCKAHIIANSTFSYWGSKLVDKENHLCIYPSKWFANPEWNIPDIFPDYWTSI